MSFSDVTSLALGKFLQQSFSSGVLDQLSQYYKEFDLVKQLKVSGSIPRNLNFLLQTGRGPSAIQYRSPGSTTEAFPSAQRNSVSEGTAVFKELDTTVEIEYSLWDRARRSPEKYAEPLALELDAKEVGSRRRIAIDFYGDGTGVVATVASATENGSPITSVDVTVRHRDYTEGSGSVDRGFIGWVEQDDLLVACLSTGTTLVSNNGTGLYAWKVTAVNRNGLTGSTFTIIPVKTDGTLVTDMTTSAINSAGVVFYRVGQNTRPTFSGISDYGSASEVLAGLESLIASDGRTIHGLAMSGALAASNQRCSNATIDTSYLNAAMNRVKNRVGTGRYKWNKMLASWEAITVFVESKEADRRFTTVDDNARGSKKFVFQHLDDTLEMVPSEFVPMNRMYILPEAGKDKVLHAHFTDFNPVSVNGSDIFNLVPTSSSYLRLVGTYMMAHMALINKHPASCVKISDFLV